MGLRTHRSPPVLISGTGFTIILILGCGRESALFASGSMLLMLTIGWAQGRLMGALLTLTLNFPHQRGPLCASYPPTIGWQEGGTPLRRGPFPRVYSRRRPSVYPIFHPFLLGRAEQLCAEWSLISHTSKNLRGPERLSPRGFSSSEPRASSQDTARTGCMLCTPVHVQHERCIPRVVGGVYTRVGVYLCTQGGVYSPVCLPTTRVYIARYASLPPWYTLVYAPYHRC